MPTRSPILKRWTPLPFSIIVPTISCPGTSGSFGFGSSPSTTCKSVRQTAQAATFTNTCVAAGFRRGQMSAARNGCRGVSRIIARIFS